MKIDLGDLPGSACEALECNGGNLGVYIDCMIAALNNALAYCPTAPAPHRNQP